MLMCESTTDSFPSQITLLGLVERERMLNVAAFGEAGAKAASSTGLCPLLPCYTNPN